MKKIVLLESTEVPCTLKKVRRSRSLRINVHQDGRVVVTAPYWESYRTMERFLGEHAEWVRLKLSRINPVIRDAASERNHYYEHRERARALIHDRLVHWSRFCGVRPNRVFIRNQKTRWGSCSAQGNLSFSYKVALLPQELCDYVIVHELCHLLELNHSTRFWAQVAAAIPDYQKRRRGLKGLVS